MWSFFKGKSGGKVHRLKRKSLIGQMVIVLLGIELFFLASFTAFEVPTATARNLNCAVAKTVKSFVSHLPPGIKQKLVQNYPRLTEPVPEARYSLYVPQGAAAVFIGYILGWPLATIAAGLFLLIGLIGPVIHFYPFSHGGGFDYYLQPSFGYLLGMVVASMVVGLITREQRTTLKQIIGLGLGLLSVHLVGLAYLLGICLFFSIFEDMHNLPTWSQWIFQEARNLSWYILPYDFICSLILIGIGFPFRWLVQVLIAPDIAINHKDEPILKDARVGEG